MCAVFLKEGSILFLKGSCPMMFELLLDVMDRFLNLRDTNAECAIALLPSKVSEVWKGLMNPNRKPYNINVFSFRIRNSVTPIIESVRTPARITPYPTGRLLRNLNGEQRN